MSARILGAFESTRKTARSRVFDITHFSRITLHSIAGIAVLVLLEVASPAQSGYIPELQPVSQSNPGLQNNFSAYTADIGFGIDALNRSATVAPEASQSSSFQQRSGEAQEPDQGSKSGADRIAQQSKPIDYGSTIYYKNKTEFGLDVGWLPVNIPFVFDFLLGDGYNKTPLNYTLVPIIASLRWQLDDVGGPWIFRGNWDLQASLGIVPIPRGPETHYFAWIMGIRRNFVPRRGKIAPYFDGRLGLGEINAKEPLGVQFAQGQNFTFTMNMGSGVRYNFSPRYSASAGLNWMHISNLYLSQPAFSNYGINVWGPMFGINVRLSKPRHDSE